MFKELAFAIGINEKARQDGSFTVPSACGGLSIKYDLSKEYTFLVFMMLKDPQGRIRFLKQLGYSEPVIAIGSNGMDTTIGGVPGEITAGEWQISVFLFAEHLKRLAGDKQIPFHVCVSDKILPVTEIIGKKVWAGADFTLSGYDFQKLYRKGAAWYKGDLHTHTRLSDGKETTQSACAKMEMMHLDYYIPTEHNTLHTGWHTAQAMIVPGIEITTTLGHANLFGVDRMPKALENILEDKNVALLERDYKNILEECHEHGWLFSINHPFLHIWKWLWRSIPLDDVDCIEIINDPTYEADPEAGAGEANRKALFLSDLLWEDGYRICAIGGSDSHNLIDERYGDANEPSIPGDPATYLHMENLSPSNLLDALLGCRAYVTRHCRIESNVDFGVQLPEREDCFPFWIMLTGPEKKPDIFYLHNGVKYSCEVTDRGGGIWIAEGNIQLSEEDYQWIRFGAYEQDGSFLFYGNPVTRGRRAHHFLTFGDAACELEKRWR